MHGQTAPRKVRHAPQDDSHAWEACMCKGNARSRDESLGKTALLRWEYHGQEDAPARRNLLPSLDGWRSDGRLRTRETAPGGLGWVLKRKQALVLWRLAQAAGLQPRDAIAGVNPAGEGLALHFLPPIKAIAARCCRAYAS